MGHHVEVFLIHSRGPLQATLDELGIPVFCADMMGFRAAAGRPFPLRVWHYIAECRRSLLLFKGLARGHFDVMHAFLFHAYAILVPWAWAARIPVRVAARRGLHANLPTTAVVDVFNRLSTAAATAVVANSAAVAVDAQQNESVPWAKMHVIRNGVAPAQTLADPTIDPPTGLLVANLIHYKGHLDLVDALVLLDPALRNLIRIRCIGEGPMRAAITASRNAAHLEDELILEGSRPAIPHYQDVQYAVLVSHQEGLPNVIMEAMAAGLPVLATDVGGCRELVEDGVTGLLVPPREPAALAAALTRMVQDVTFRAEAGRVGLERAAEFAWRGNAKTHAKLYRSLLMHRCR